MILVKYITSEKRNANLTYTEDSISHLWTEKSTCQATYSDSDNSRS
jgi:hypothetical protein